jgi:disulfide bond formation protein DsbB
MNYIGQEWPPTHVEQRRRHIPRGWVVLGMAAAAWLVVLSLGLGVRTLGELIW